MPQSGIYAIIGAQRYQREQMIMANVRKIDSSRMGEMNEGKLLLSMAVPIMLSMLVQALYNIVDSIFVARVSEDCLSALSLAFLPLLACIGPAAEAAEASESAPVTGPV